MKKTISYVLIFVIFSCFTVNEIDAQTNRDPRNSPRQPSGPRPRTIDTTQIDSVTNTVQEDREVTFNLKKLSMLASLSVYGNPKFESNGLVVLEINVNENGTVVSSVIRESDNPKLNRFATDAVRDYARRYKLQPAIKAGKPVAQEGILLPIIFDMSIFEQDK